MVSLEDARRVARCFQVDEPMEVRDFTGKGNINLDTLLVTSGSERYLLQRINSDVFTMPERVMAGMIAALDAQREALDRGVGHREGWRVPDLVLTRDGHRFLVDEGVWRMMTFLGETVSFKSLADAGSDRRLDLAREVGRGLAVYSDLTSSIDAGRIPTSLPGYRNTRLYFQQLHAALEGATTYDHVSHRVPEDDEVRASTERHFYCALPEEEWRTRRFDPELESFIAAALEFETLATGMQSLREQGAIRATVIHGDTKLENFLFCERTGRVVSLIDLDTVMPHSWLADWGDMVRSLANVAGEKERDLSRIEVDRDVYAAVAEGFLRNATTPTPDEIELMPRAVLAITLELGVRFLADYIRGDTYFRLLPDDPPDLNKVRAMVQLRLFQKLLEHEAEAHSYRERFR